MRITIHPLSAPEREVDVTEGLVKAIADRLSEVSGGSRVLDELEAECHLRRLVGAAARGEGEVPQ